VTKESAKAGLALVALLLALWFLSLAVRP